MQGPTAAMLVIGDEILSGRTQDANIQHVARVLAGLGIDLCEARVVADIEDEIVAAVNALRARYTYVFTTGGIGPTHDDITAEAIAKAFGVPLEESPEAIALMLPHYKSPSDLNEARRRMARLPKGAQLIKNGVSGPPGFQIDNVLVMAGVPVIMRAMLEDAVAKLKTGIPVTSLTIASDLPEGAFATPLAALQKNHPHVAIGSYPSYGEGKPRSSLVVRGRDTRAVEEAALAIEALLRELGASPTRAS